jgi:deoxycytidine triphosphate deaminase
MDRKETERNILQELPCPEDDALIRPGVLLSDEIERLVAQFKLIDPFYTENLKAAGYELTVGDEYAIGGKIGTLEDEPGRREVTIPPFEVLIIKTRERINMPRFLIARWNIRVKWAYEGLLWVGGPQVDPGFVGHLSCPIYNLSNKEVTLRFGEPIALMDFVTTTPFKKDESKPYKRPPNRIVFEDYHPTTLKSALFTEARERINDVERKVSTVETRLNTTIGVFFPMIAILFAAIAIFVSSAKEVSVTLPIWVYGSTGFSIFALVLSIIALTKVGFRGNRIPPPDLTQRIGKLERLSILIIVTQVAMIALLIWKFVFSY